MNEIVFKGIENVDSDGLKRQRALTAALWENLESQGWVSGTVARIECFFFAHTIEAASALGTAFSDWEAHVADSSDDKKAVRLKTQPVCLTKQALLELVDVVMIAAQENTCTFDGFQIETTSLQKKKSWWQF